MGSSPTRETWASGGETIAQALQSVLALRLGGNGQAEILDTISGNINRIYKIEYLGRTLGVRLAVNQYRFKYEKDVIKEVFAIQLISHSKPSPGDSVARDIVDDALRHPVGSDIGHGRVHDIIHYDWSMQTLPYPFFVFEWVEGEPLWRDGGASQYFLAGQDLAWLHEISFESYYQDIFGIGRAPLDWAAGFGLSLARELALAEPRLPPDLFAQIAAFDTASLEAGRPALVHNDYAGGNIIVEPGGGRRIVDWDNWVIDSPELDAIKMKYWTGLGDDGLLAHEPALFAAFLEGYASAGARPLDERLMGAYELLWLLRAFNFENAIQEEREMPAASTSWSAHYPPAAAYVEYLRGM